jgi:hypothetical protein
LPAFPYSLFYTSITTTTISIASSTAFSPNRPRAKTLHQPVDPLSLTHSPSLYELCPLFFFFTIFFSIRLHADFTMPAVGLLRSFFIGWFYMVARPLMFSPK